MIYRLPEGNDEALLKDYVQEHYKQDETSISASLGLTDSDYFTWVRKIRDNNAVGNEQWGKSLLYLCLDNDRLIGLLSIRYDLSKRLSEIYGDIGYGVRPSERRKGYGAAMLAYGLSVCKEKGKKRVILGCYKDNIASASTIIKNGGKLIVENDNYEKGKISQFYAIEL